MNYCPNVIHFNNRVNNFNWWIQFLIGHQKCGLWKLESLPAYKSFDGDSKKIRIYWWNCIGTIFQEILKELHLSTEYLKGDFTFLEDLASLTKLEISDQHSTDSPLKSLEAIDNKLMQYLPYLEEINIRFSRRQQMYIQDDQEGDITNDSALNKTSSYENLKKMWLRNLMHPKVEEFSAFAKRFTGLVDIQLDYTAYQDNYPTETVIDLSRGISSYSISFEIEKNEIQYFQTYHNSGQDRVDRRQRYMNVYFSRFGEDYNKKEDTVVTIQSWHCTKGYTESIDLCYDMATREANLYFKAHRTFVFNSGYVKKINFCIERSCNFDWMQADTYLYFLKGVDPLISYLNGFTVSSATLLTRYSSERLRTPNYNIKSLTLCFTEIDPKILPYLSISFPSLKLMELETCWFGRSSVTIHMRSTTFDTLSLCKPIMQDGNFSTTYENRVV